MNKSKIIKTTKRRIVWTFICECCGAQGELTLPKQGFDFNCPECNSRYYQWNNPIKADWDLTCIVGVMFEPTQKEGG